MIFLLFVYLIPKTMTSKQHSTCTAFLSLTPSKARADVLTGTETRYYLVTLPHVTAGGKKTTKDIAYRPCSKQVLKDQVFCMDHHKQQKVKEIITWKDISGKATCLNPVKKETTNADTDPHLFHIHQPLQFKMTQKQIDVLKKLFPVVNESSSKKEEEEEEESSSSSSSSSEEEEEEEKSSSSSSSSSSEEDDEEDKVEEEEEEEEEDKSSSSSSSSEEEEEEESSAEEESDKISVVELLDVDVEENKKWETMEKMYSYSLERCVEVYIHTSTKPLFYDEKMNVVCDAKKDVRGYMIPIQLDQAPIIYDGQFYTITRPTLREGMVFQRCQYSNRIFALNKTKKWVFVGTEEPGGVKWNTTSV